MLIEATQALSSIKSITDLLTLISKTKTDTAIAQKAIELQSTIISLQTSLMSIQLEAQKNLTEKEELKKQIEIIDNWSVTEQEYKLSEIAAGVFIYNLREANGDSVSHWLCVHCFGNRHKSILQRQKMTDSGTEYICPNCQNIIIDHNNRVKRPQIVRSHSSSPFI